MTEDLPSDGKCRRIGVGRCFDCLHSLQVGVRSYPQSWANRCFHIRRAQRRERGVMNIQGGLAGHAL